MATEYIYYNYKPLYRSRLRGLIHRGHYNMSGSKENYNKATRSDYIRYLYREGQRQDIQKNPNFYSEIIKFVDTPEGQESLKKFIQLDPYILGITKSRPSHLIKRAFS